MSSSSSQLKSGALSSYAQGTAAPQPHAYVPSGTPIEEGGDKTNPSYQNYLAKQMLSDSSTQSLVSQMPSALPAVLVPPPGHEPKDPTPEEFSRLNTVLDQIESQKDDEDEAETAAAAPTHAAQTELVQQENPFDWTKLYDSNTGYFYYANARTGVTQWEAPPGFQEQEVAMSQSSVDIYAAHAHFNRQSGRFMHSGSETYWSKMGRPEDREGRQMSAFFDISQLDINRQEAKEKKKKLLEMKGMDWRKYKEDRKKKRQKIQYRWLYEET